MKSKNNQSIAGFFSFELLVLLLFLVFITGIGQAIWRHSIKMGDYCYQAISTIEFYDVQPFCSKISMFMADLDYKVGKALGVAGYGKGMSQDDLLKEMSDYFHLSWVGLNTDKLKSYIDPNMLSMKYAELKQSGANKLHEFKYAMTQGQFGSDLFKRGDISGIGYMQNAAGIGDYGVLSQLQLGSIYGGGLGGIKQNLGAAKYYHMQAYQSLQHLQLDSSPMAQKVISSLPASPAELMQNIKNITGQ
jgi:hypothetical protein